MSTNAKPSALPSQLDGPRTRPGLRFHPVTVSQCHNLMLPSLHRIYQPPCPQPRRRDHLRHTRSRTYKPTLPLTRTLRPHLSPSQTSRYTTVSVPQWRTRSDLPDRGHHPPRQCSSTHSKPPYMRSTRAPGTPDTGPTSEDGTLPTLLGHPILRHPTLRPAHLTLPNVVSQSTLCHNLSSPT